MLVEGCRETLDVRADEAARCKTREWVVVRWQRAKERDRLPTYRDLVTLAIGDAAQPLARVLAQFADPDLLHVLHNSTHTAIPQSRVRAAASHKQGLS